MATRPARLQREIDEVLSGAPARAKTTLTLTPQRFSAILSSVRDDTLAQMRRDGFWSKGVIRHDATPWDLNNGGCIEFAERLIELVGDQYPKERITQVSLEQFDPDLAHDVVKWRRKFYDAECVTGVARWQDLPIVRNRKKTRAQVLRERRA